MGPRERSAARSLPPTVPWLEGRPRGTIVDAGREALPKGQPPTSSAYKAGDGTSPEDVPRPRLPETRRLSAPCVAPGIWTPTHARKLVCTIRVNASGALYYYAPTARYVCGWPLVANNHRSRLKEVATGFTGVDPWVTHASLRRASARHQTVSRYRRHVTTDSHGLLCCWLPLFHSLAMTCGLDAPTTSGSARMLPLAPR